MHSQVSCRMCGAPHSDSHLLYIKPRVRVYTQEEEQRCLCYVLTTWGVKHFNANNPCTLPRRCLSIIHLEINGRWIIGIPSAQPSIIHLTQSIDAFNTFWYPWRCPISRIQLQNTVAHQLHTYYVATGIHSVMLHVPRQLLLMQVQIVVKARSRADVGVAFGALEKLSSNGESQQYHHHLDRPQSAPTTRLESLRACRQVTSSAGPSPTTTRQERVKSISSTHTKPSQRKLRPKSCFVSSTQVS